MKVILYNLAIVRIVDKYIGNLFIYCFFIYEKLLRRRVASSPPDIKRIVAVKLHGIGNLIMIMPTLYAVKKKYPHTDIDVVTLMSNKGLLEGYEFIANIHYLNNSSLLKFIISVFSTIILLRRLSCNIVLDFEQFANISAVISFLICKEERVGFNTPGQNRGIIYTKRIAYLDCLHMIETFARIGKGINIEKVDTKLIPIPFLEDNISNIKALFESNNIKTKDSVIVIHCGTSHNMEYRRWDYKKFAGIANLLISKYKIKIIFTGTKLESSIVDKIIELIPHKDNVVNAVQKLSLKDVTCLVTKCCFVISNDTSLVHIASAAGIPVVGFYGPNTPFLYGPLGNNNIIFYKDLYCSPCITNYNQKYSKCKNPLCMEFTVEDVFREVERCLLPH